jgi:hypothetical protein
MNSTMRFSVFAFSALLVAGSSGNAAAQQATMSFFVTSAGSGEGADLGGLAGADRICQQLTQAAGAGSLPGMPISAPKPPTVNRRSTPGTASARVRGRTPKGRSSPRMSTICTATTTT